MIRRSPAEKYIQYLMLHPLKHSDKDVKAILEEEHIEFLSDNYLVKLRSRLDPPDNFRPRNLEHTESQNYLLRLGLYAMFHPTKEVSRAFDLLSDARAREFAEALIISRAPPATIAAGLCQRKFRCDARAVQHYKEFFWNIDLVDSTEMRALLDLRVERLGVSADEEKQLHHKVLRRANFQDARRVAANTPQNYLSAMIAQMRMGFMAKKVNIVAILQKTQEACALQMLETSVSGGFEASKQLLDYTTSFTKITEVMALVVPPEEALKKGIQELAMRHNTKPLVSLTSLTGGRHTVDNTPALGDTLNDDFSDDDEDGSGDLPTLGG